MRWIFTVLFRVWETLRGEVLSIKVSAGRYSRQMEQSKKVLEAGDRRTEEKLRQSKAGTHGEGGWRDRN